MVFDEPFNNIIFNRNFTPVLQTEVSAVGAFPAAAFSGASSAGSSEAAQAQLEPFLKQPLLKLLLKLLLQDLREQFKPSWSLSCSSLFWSFVCRIFGSSSSSVGAFPEAAFAGASSAGSSEAVQATSRPKCFQKTTTKTAAAYYYQTIFKHEINMM